MASSSESDSTIVNQNLSVINPGNKISTVKLNDDNFLLWRLQVLTALQGHGLEKFIDPDAEIPAEVIRSAEESSSTLIMNPEFTNWKRQDKLITSWLLGSMSEEILSQMLECETAKEVWIILDNIFSSRNLARVMQLKSKLENMKKVNLTLKEYFLKVKNIVDSLNAAGKKIPKEDHVMHLLAGLGTEFDSTVSVIAARTGTPTLQEVYSLLLAQEGRNERNNINSDASLPSVNLTTQDQSKKHNPSNSSDNRGNWNNYRGKGGNRSTRGRNWNNNSKIQYQLCGRFGHTALKCYMRFDRAYQGPNASTNLPFNSQQTSQFMNTQTYGSQQYQQAPLNALMVSPDVNKDTNWCPDLGASIHVINDFGNLSFGADYSGNNKVHVGNGAGLDIHHIGSSILHSPSSSNVFILKNLLHVPQITKNLISVSTFAKDNSVTFAKDDSVYFEFHPFDCFVKDLKTGQVLLKGKVSDGLYKFSLEKASSTPPLSSNHGVEFCPVTSPQLQHLTFDFSFPTAHSKHLPSVHDIWHWRLDNANSSVVKHVLQSCNISYSNNKVPSLCHACAIGKSHLYLLLILCLCTQPLYN